MTVLFKLKKNDLDKKKKTQILFTEAFHSLYKKLQNIFENLFFPF